jgi:hypothetical protein
MFSSEVFVGCTFDIVCTQQKMSISPIIFLLLDELVILVVDHNFWQ